MHRSTRRKSKTTPPTSPTPLSPHPRQMPSTSPLQQMPAEIRDHIYTLLLVSNKPLQPDISSLFKSTEAHEMSSKPFLSLPHEQTLAIARTCNQIHDEVVSVYFGCNTFKFKDTYDLYVYLYMIGSHRRSCVRSVEFKFRGVQRIAAFELLRECIALKSLKFTVDYETMLSAKLPQKDLWTARGVNALRRIKGLKWLKIQIDQAFRYDYSTGQNVKCFGDEYLEEFERSLQNEMREEKLPDEEELKKEKSRLERRSQREREMEELRAKTIKQWSEFEETKAQQGERRSKRVCGKEKEIDKAKAEQGQDAS